MATKVHISFDASDPPALARFWALALGYVEEPPPPGFDTWEAFAESHGMGPEAVERYGAVIDPDGAGPRLLFQMVPEGKAAKNRVHLDVVAPGASEGQDHEADIEAHAERLVQAGATRIARHEEFGKAWVVLQDPEGNEFCLV